MCVKFCSILLLLVDLQCAKCLLGRSMLAKMPYTTKAPWNIAAHNAMHQHGKPSVWAGIH